MTQKEIEIYYGDLAMDLISDYPIYAATSNISYFEAIQIAYVLDLFDIADKIAIKPFMKF